jgi:hypothetical protein
VISVRISSRLCGTDATAELIAERFANRVYRTDSPSLNAALDDAPEERSAIHSFRTLKVNFHGSQAGD